MAEPMVSAQTAIAELRRVEEAAMKALIERREQIDRLDEERDDAVRTVAAWASHHEAWTERYRMLLYEAWGVIDRAALALARQPRDDDRVRVLGELRECRDHLASELGEDSPADPSRGEKLGWTPPNRGGSDG